MTQSKELIREYKIGDEVQILKLFKEIFRVHRSIEHWRWKFMDHIKGQGWITLAESNRNIIAQYCVMRNHLNFMGREVVAAQSCDTMVKSDQRGKGWFTKLAKRNYSHASANGVKTIFGFPNRESYPGFMRNLAWYRIVNLKYFYFRMGFKKIFGTSIDRKLKPFYSISNKVKYFAELSRQQQDIRIVVSSNLSDSLDFMLKEALNYEVLSIWKDLRYLRWRYENHPDYRYNFHILSCRGQPKCLAVCRDCGDSIAICELIHRTKNIPQSILLLRHMLYYYHNSNAQKIEFIGYDNGFYDAVFSNIGFKIEPSSNFIFGGLVFNDMRLEKFFPFPQNWTITYGDTDVI